MSEKRYIKTVPIADNAGDLEIQNNMKKNNWLTLSILNLLIRSNGAIEPSFDELTKKVLTTNIKLYKHEDRQLLKHNLVELFKNWEQAAKLPIFKISIIDEIKDGHPYQFDWNKMYDKYMKENHEKNTITYFDTHQMLKDIVDEDDNITNNKELQKQMCDELREYLTALYKESIEEESEE